MFLDLRIQQAIRCKAVSKISGVLRRSSTVAQRAKARCSRVATGQQQKAQLVTVLNEQGRIVEVGPKISNRFDAVFVGFADRKRTLYLTGIPPLGAISCVANEQHVVSPPA